MKNKIFILTFFISILTLGLIYNLFDANNKINSSFSINKQLNNLKVFNRDINFKLNKNESKNYDNINHLTLSVNNLVKSIENNINKQHIQNKNILDNIRILKNKLEDKINLVEQCKSSSAILDNSSKNSLKLTQIIQLQNINYKDMEMFNKITFAILSTNKTTKIKTLSQITKLKKLIDNKYTYNKEMLLFMRNANIYNNKYIDNKKLTKKLHHIQLSKHIDNLITSYTTYNKSIMRPLHNQTTSISSKILNN